MDFEYYVMCLGFGELVPLSEVTRDCHDVGQMKKKIGIPGEVTGMYPFKGFWLRFLSYAARSK